MNNGPSNGTGITLLDPIPPGLTYIAADSGGDGTYDPDTGLWTVGSLAKGAHATFDLVVTTSRSGIVRQPRDAADGVTRGLQPQEQLLAVASIDVRAPVADLSIVKEVFPQTAVVGDTVTYQLVVSNQGPDTVRNVYVTDVGPGGVTILTATATQGTIDPAVPRWDVGTLASGDSAQATVTVRVDTAGTKVNTVVVDAPLLVDPNPEDNSSSATLTTLAPAVDVGVTKTVARVGGGSTTAVPLGQQVDFTITATNNAVAGSPATDRDERGLPRHPRAGIDLRVRDRVRHL